MGYKSSWEPEVGDYVHTYASLKYGDIGYINAPNHAVFIVKELLYQGWQADEHDFLISSGDYEFVVSQSDLRSAEGEEEEYTKTVENLKAIIEAKKAENLAATEKREKGELYRLLNKYGIPDGYV